MKPIQTGLESLLASPPRELTGQRLGILCNHASVNRAFKHARLLIEALFPGKIKALFSPQHGFYSEKQDNMVESADGTDPVLGVPVYSLYGRTRVPEQRMFDSIDTLIVDLQDVGTRVYTYASTLSYCLEAAKAFDKRVVLLDRPNPIGGESVEGNCLRPEMRSFVGRYPIPMRHGMTLGELALLMNQHFGIGCRLEVIKMQGWRRRMFFPATGLPWVAPSPNLPTFQSALVYPGQVIWEGTNVSEGRGTTQPFECFGAPYFDIKKLVAVLQDTPGIILRDIVFEPTANKWAGMSCRGFQLHVIDPLRYKPYESSLMLLQAVLNVHGDTFQWKQPPYEYEYEKLPIDLVIGDAALRKRLEQQEDLGDIVASWQEDLTRFKTLSRRFHLYR